MIVGAAEAVFDGGEFVSARSAVFAVGEIDMDLAFVAA